MSKDDNSLRSPQDAADAALLAKMGTDPEAWARELWKVMPPGGYQTLTAAWFHHAIEAGRRDAAATMVGTSSIQPESRSPAVWGASGFELRTLAVTARASLARLREYIGFDQNERQLEALELVDWLLGSTIEDPAFRDEAGR